jgi:hypothetical protein
MGEAARKASINPIRLIIRPILQHISYSPGGLSEKLPGKRYHRFGEPAMTLQFCRGRMDMRP